MIKPTDILNYYLVDVASVSHRIEKVAITADGYEITADGDTYTFGETAFMELIFAGHTADWKFNLSDH